MTLAEWCAALAVTVLACHLHATFLTNAGGLWRDEVVTFNIADAYSVAGVWRDLSFESSPGLTHFLLHGWTSLGLGQTDLRIRTFGFLVGIAVLGTLLLDARLLGARLPWVSLGLVALPSLTVRTTDAIRPYGVGVLCILLALGLVWRFAEAPSARRGLVAAAAAVLSVQALYQNAFLLLAICLAAALVALRRGRWTGAVGALGVGLLAALSLLLYVGKLRHLSELNELLTRQVSVARILDVSAAALQDGSPFMLWIWAALAGIALAVAIAAQRARSDVADRALFAAIVAFVASLGFFVWLMILGLPTQPWYYLPPIAIVAVALDAIFGTLRSTAARLLRVTVLVGIAALVYPTAIPGVQVRQTNVDLIAAHLQKLPEEDFILVHEWYCGATFSRYYRGRTRWATLPPLGDQRLQRLDLFKQYMTTPDAIRPVLDTISRTLETGHRVWLVGGLPFFSAGEPAPPDVPPAPHPMTGWDHDAYSAMWARQAAYLVQSRAHEIGLLSVPAPRSVNALEDLPLVAARGWRGPAPEAGTGNQ